MTSLADRTTTALTNEHAAIAAIAASLNDDQLAGPSGASEWPLHQVFSHLGSGAEITLAGLRTALGAAAPHEDFNQSVWDRWNAMTPREQLTGFLTQDATLVQALNDLDAHQRDTLQLEVGFLPFPLSAASFAGMRLNEAAQHGWDIRVALDPHAGVANGSAHALFEQYSSGLGFMLGFVANDHRFGHADLARSRRDRHLHRTARSRRTPARRTARMTPHNCRRPGCACSRTSRREFSGTDRV